MTRKDVAQDLERPHYYSQFWIDVAMGKRDIAVGRIAEPELEDEEDTLEHEPIEPVVKPPVKAKAKAPEKKPEPVRPTITSLADLANIDLLMKNSAEMGDGEAPDIESGAMDDFAPFATAPDIEAPAVVAPPLDATEPTAASEDDADFEFEDEDEEDDEWGAGRRKPKPRRRDRRTTF